MIKHLKKLARKFKEACRTMTQWFFWLMTRYIGIYHVFLIFFVPFCLIFQPLYVGIIGACREIAELFDLTWEEFKGQVKDVYTRREYLAMKSLVEREIARKED